MPARQILLPLLVPMVVLAAAALILWKWPRVSPSSDELRALMVLLPLLPYALFVVVGGIGLRYGNAGLLLSALAMALCYAFVGFPGADLPAGHPAATAALFLLPLNIGLFSALMRRRLKTLVGIGSLLGLAMQAGAVLLLSRMPAGRVAAELGRLLPPAAPVVESVSAALAEAFAPAVGFGAGQMPALTAACYAVAAGVLLLSFFLGHNALTAGLAGALAAAFLAAVGSAGAMGETVYYAAAGLIMAAAGIEASFMLAYTDELTGLPGRRRLNEELLNLGRRYALAMIDVDHFKKFNDRYGHDAGDQVLKMIAKNLASLSGGGKAFRYGGEEFTAVFPGKDMDEALPHVERYRRRVAAAAFIVRGKQRKKAGPENRGSAPRTRQVAVQVTVSIGLAGPHRGAADPAAVLKAADQALYRAKRAGRNRIRTVE